MTYVKFSIITLVLVLATMTSSRASLIINIYEESGNLVFDYSGSVDLLSTDGFAGNDSFYRRDRGL